MRPLTVRQCVDAGPATVRANKTPRRFDRALVSRLAAAAAFGLLIPIAWAETAPESLYARHCAACHGAERLGGMGPALLPENLTRVKPERAARSIAAGLPATQMPAFGDVLGDREIQGLVDLIYTPLAEIPAWGLEEIRGSSIQYAHAETLGAEPRFEADPQNLFIVVELGDHHATVLDGDRFEPIHRFETRPNLHGGPKFSPDGRFVYFASRDGWISKFDIYNLVTLAEVRAGINTRNIAVSADGRFVIAGNYLPHTLVVLDAETLDPVKVIPVNDGRGSSSRVSAVYTAPPRHTFVVALKDLREVWEIPYSDEALPVYTGMMHDHRRESGEEPLIDQGEFPVRRIQVDDYLDDFFFDQAYRHLIGASREGGGQVVHLDVGRVIAKLDLAGLPHLGSGISWEHEGRPILVTPNLKEASLSVVDMKSWKVTQRIETLGPGFFMRSHDGSRYAWTDVFLGPNRDAVHILNKETLEITKTLRPSPGKTAAHVEFTRDGRYALLSIWDTDGALIVYDGDSLEEIKRIPMNKPSGKYNVHNKTHYAAGTSH